MTVDVKFSGRSVGGDVAGVVTRERTGHNAELVKKGTDGPLADTVGTVGNPGEVEGVIGVVVDIEGVGIMGCFVADFGYKIVGGSVRGEVEDRIVGVGAVDIDFDVGQEFGVEYAVEGLGDLAESFVAVDRCGKTS